MNLGPELNDKWLTWPLKAKASLEAGRTFPVSDITQGD